MDRYNVLIVCAGHNPSFKKEQFESLQKEQYLKKILNIRIISVSFSFVETLCYPVRTWESWKNEKNWYDIVLVELN